MSDLTIEDTDEQAHVVNASAFASSDLFFKIYDESMAMVREAADYLELEGVIERQQLSQKLGLVYACESMRLTTRLMQVSAWLLAMRAIRQGELQAGEIDERGFRLGAKEVCIGDPVRGAGLLPVRLINLLEASKRLYERVARLDQLLFAGAGQLPAHNPVVAQLSRLEQAFCI
jgi:regulator of CtrA degradation